MGVCLELVNFNRLIAEAPGVPIILNDLESVTEEDRARISTLTTTVYQQTDVFSNQPSCECGNVMGGFNLGVTCPICRTEVTEMFSQDLTPRIWIRSPQHVAALINPMVWTMLKLKFTKVGFSLVEWLCNTDYQPSGTRPNLEIEELMSMGVERGYNNFVKNFDEYFDKLCSIKHFAKKHDDDLKTLIRTQRDCVFSQFIPLPNKAMLIRENTNVGNYIDPMVLSILDAIRTIVSIDTKMSSYTLRQKENRTIKTIDKLSAYYYDSYHSLIAKKPGLIRKHIFGTRCHFSSRAVISSNTKEHAYDELHLAWGQGVTMFKIHLMNKLMRRGYTPNEGTSLLQEYTAKYHPLLDELFNELFAEAKDNSFYCIFVRNPSLTRGSTQRMRITKIKTDPNDITITLSILSVKGFNADQ